jgi:hypothetical protein
LLSAPTDIAWEHSRFGWADLLIDGIFIPVHHGQAVSYRPPRWDEHGREGSIEVPAGCPLLIIEGNGARRREAAHPINTLIWVQADEREAGRRSVARSAIGPGPTWPTWPLTGRRCPARASPNPAAAGPHGRRVLFMVGTADHAVTPQALWCSSSTCAGRADAVGRGRGDHLMRLRVLAGSQHQGRMRASSGQDLVGPVLLRPDVPATHLDSADPAPCAFRHGEQAHESDHP